MKGKHTRNPISCIVSANVSITLFVYHTKSFAVINIPLRNVLMTAAIGLRSFPVLAFRGGNPFFTTNNPPYGAVQKQRIVRLITSP